MKVNYLVGTISDKGNIWFYSSVHSFRFLVLGEMEITHSFRIRIKDFQL